MIEQRADCRCGGDRAVVRDLLSVVGHGSGDWPAGRQRRSLLRSAAFASHFGHSIRHEAY